VAPRARSNYAQTMLSLSSSLNMEYLDFLDKSPGEKSRVRLPLFALMRDSEVCRLFRSAGYTIVDLPSAFVGRRQINADVYVAGRGEAESFELSSFRHDPDSRCLRQGQAAEGDFAVASILPRSTDNRTLAQLADLGLKPEDRTRSSSSHT